MKKIAIIALGKPNSGKSSTWYEIFERRIYTGYKILKLKNFQLNIYVQNTSFEENKGKISESPISKEFPSIVFCSVQYNEEGINTIEWFQKEEYYLYIQWLNPGYKYDDSYEDFLGIEEKFKKYGEFHKVSGKEKTDRVTKIKDFLYKSLNK